MDERLYYAIAAELQGMALPEERLRRAAAAAAPVEHKVSLSALDRLGFDDSPYDYPALFAAAQRGQR